MSLCLKRQRTEIYRDSMIVPSGFNFSEWSVNDTGMDKQTYLQSPEKRMKTSHYAEMKYPLVHKYYTELKTPIYSDISNSYQLPSETAVGIKDSQKQMPVYVENSVSSLALGVELSATSYNMSEALLTLPVFKQDSSKNNFQYILGSATSPAVKLNEETLTYLNQGQSYEVKMKNHGAITGSKGLYRSTLRVCFHDRRLQFTETEQLNFWSKSRPGERILDVDIPLSYGLIDVIVNPREHNTIDFVWDSSKDTGIYVRVNCISTEFTHRKHGGEKGVPFRLQVETRDSESQDSQLIHCASCQMRVFKPKGADRKYKTDWAKMSKKTLIEKENYHPSYQCTLLTEIPVEHVIQAQVEKQQSLVHKEWKVSSSSDQFSLSSLPISHSSLPISHSSLPISRSSLPICSSPSSPPGTDIKLEHSTSPNMLKYPPSSPGSTKSVSSDGSFTTLGIPKTMSIHATAKEVKAWLYHNRFANYINVFQNFTGADVLRLNRNDLVQICGIADGIRLNNALLSDSVRSRLSVFICMETDAAFTAVYLEQFSSQELIKKITDIAKIGQCTISDVFIQGPSEINVRLTNDVVQNLPDQTRLVIKIIGDAENPNCVRILLKRLE